MATSLNALAASEHVADLHRAAPGRGAGRPALRRRRGRSTATVGDARPVAVVRFAHPDEAGTLRRLAQAAGKRPSLRASHGWRTTAGVASSSDRPGLDGERRS